MRVVSFFAGCGGLDLGFEQAGFNVVWANELDQNCRSTYLRNHPHTELVIGDICKIDPTSIPDCDGFIGGPPCQSWSVGGKQRGLEDERGQLFLKYIDLIKIKYPNFFVIENVKGILSPKFNKEFNNFLYQLDLIGYNVKWDLLDAINYRVPQNRERVFIIGFKKELQIDYKFPEFTTTTPLTLKQAIGDISEIPHYYSHSSEKIRINESRLNHDVLNSKFGPFYYRGNRKRGWFQPSFTINATADYAPLHPGSPKMMYFGHENWNFQKDKLNLYRRLSVRECARIQTFPDNFEFIYDNIKVGYKMIGNAVPPRLAFEIAKSIKSVLNKDTVILNNILNVSTPNIINNQTSVLVGYCKNVSHRNLILKHGIYYVRSDGRTGSIFREDCSVIPDYLILHNKNEVGLLPLDGEEPVLVSATYLKSLGFKPKGEKYLCFKLKNGPIELNTIEEIRKINKFSYTPYFTTLEALSIKINYERKQ